MDLDLLGKGAIEDSVDNRDFQASTMMGASQINWDDPFFLPEPPDNDQDGSSSCVSQAWSYYHWQLHGKDYSRKDLYSRIAQPEGGANIRDGGLELVKRGQATRDEVPDPSPESEALMKAGAGTPAQEASDKELSSFVLAKDIDTIANAIKQYKGVVFGLFGNNDTWHDLENPEPPSPNTPNWGHALYLYAYHMHAGQKCVVAKSSWCNSVKQHHIKENYFNAGMTFNPWTLIPQGETMTNALILKHGGEYGVYLPATSADGLITLLRNVGITPPLNADGTLDFPEVDKLVQGNF